MRILYFYQYFTTPRGAWSTRAYEFARRWVAAGHRVTVVTGVYDKSDLEPSGLVARLEIDGIDVRVIGLRLANRHGFWRRVATFALYALVSSWYALREEADVVLCSSGPISVGLPGLVARRLRRRPLLFEVRDLWPEGAIQLGILEGRSSVRLARALEAACYRAASLVVTLSPGQRDDLLRRFPALPLAVVPNASDNELVASLTDGWREPDWAGGRRIALYAGTLGLIDDGGQLLDLAAELGRRGRDDILVVIIGDGGERRALERRAASEGLTGVRFLGLQSRTEVFRWLCRADLSVVTIKDVPFLATASPNKLFDAFAAGRPVVQTTQGWMKELLEREGCGLTVAPGDTVAMADAVERLVDDAGLRAALGANSKRVAVERFDRSALAARMLGHLEEVSGGKGA
jgi:glycosyltransferase involved in cell wall biosynthesis